MTACSSSIPERASLPSRRRRPPPPPPVILGINSRAFAPRASGSTRPAATACACPSSASRSRPPIASVLDLAPLVGPGIPELSGLVALDIFAGQDDHHPAARARTRRRDRLESAGPHERRAGPRPLSVDGSTAQSTCQPAAPGWKSTSAISGRSWSVSTSRHRLACPRSRPIDNRRTSPWPWHPRSRPRPRGPLDHGRRHPPERAPSMRHHAGPRERPSLARPGGRAMPALLTAPPKWCALDRLREARS